MINLPITSTILKVWLELLLMIYFAECLPISIIKLWLFFLIYLVILIVIKLLILLSKINYILLLI